MGLALYDLYMAFLNCSFPMILLTSGIMLLVADIQTGMLHITLDNRLSFNFPVLSQPCMEFQWLYIILLVVSKFYSFILPSIAIGLRTPVTNTMIFLTKLLHQHHKIHHIAPHNENHCLIGLGDFIIAPMAKYIPALLGESIYIFFSSSVC